jgi:FkbM family methyltransferase
MSKYQLKLSAKTKVLNFFRYIFFLPLFDNLLLLATLNTDSPIIKKLVPPNYLYKKGKYKKVNRNGINYQLDISNVVDHSFYFNLEKPSYHSILSEIKKATVILDIGGNIGTSALYFASINPTARILSFEPHPDTFNKAVENIELNSFQNIELINLGLGTQQASLKLYEVDKYNPGMNRILSEEADFPYKIIEVDILDDILLKKEIKKVDFIKIDVEGYEFSVLSGAKETLKSKPFLFIEVNDTSLKENKSSAKEIIELLITAGYTTFYRADNGEAISSNTNFINCHFDLIAK